MSWAALERSWARWRAGVWDQAGKAAWAASMACLVSSRPASAQRARSSPVAGLWTSKVFLEVDWRHSPLMKMPWVGVSVVDLAGVFSRVVDMGAPGVMLRSVYRGFRCAGDAVPGPLLGTLPRDRPSALPPA